MVVESQRRRADLRAAPVLVTSPAIQVVLGSWIMERREQQLHLKCPGRGQPGGLSVRTEGQRKGNRGLKMHSFQMRRWRKCESKGHGARSSPARTQQQAGVHGRGPRAGRNLSSSRAPEDIVRILGVSPSPTSIG